MRLATWNVNQDCEELARFFVLAAESLPYPARDALFIEDALYDKALRPVEPATC